MGYGAWSMCKEPEWLPSSEQGARNVLEHVECFRLGVCQQLRQQKDIRWR